MQRARYLPPYAPLHLAHVLSPQARRSPAISSEGCNRRSRKGNDLGVFHPSSPSSYCIRATANVLLRDLRFPKLPPRPLLGLKNFLLAFLQLEVRNEQILHSIEALGLALQVLNGE